MPGHRESIFAMGVAIQPVAGTFTAPTSADIIPVSAPDNGDDPITADDDTLTGSVWTAARQFLGRRGRAGATARLRGWGSGTMPVANAFVLGRILQAAGFTEFVNAAAVTGTAAANAATDRIVLAAAASAVDDFYKGFPISHAGLGVGMRSYSMIRAYNGTSKQATISEDATAAIAAGNYTIPPGLFYTLGAGNGIPLLSVSMWRHRKRYDYKDCALSSFAINLPVSNDASTDSPTVEFAMVGVPVTPTDELAPSIPSGLLIPPPPVKAGKFALAKKLIGHQSLRLEFGLDAGAPPNQNFDAGQESYEVLSGTRTISLDLNQQLMATLNLEALVDNQTLTPIQSIFGLGTGNNWGIGVANALLNPFSVAPRNGFVGMTGDAVPNDIDRSVSICLF